MASLPSGNPSALGASQQRSNGVTSREQAYITRMGERGYKRFEAIKKEERQRVWDNMRLVAAARYNDGLMPQWFRKEWLDIEEAPTNTWWRQQGLSAYQTDTTWLGENAPSTSSSGGDGGSSSGSGGGGGGGSSWPPRWWREEDPYWPLRDWGDHPMRWWTWGLAAVLAAGGVAVHAWSGDPGAVFVGLGSAAVLGLSALGMSDMSSRWIGALGVKAAFATCALLAHLDFNGRGLQPVVPQQNPNCYSPLLQQRQQQQQQHWDSSSSSSSSSRVTGWLCLCAAGWYVLTGMSGLWEGTGLPTNPGEAFKMPDIAQRHKIWDYWGYGDVTMR